MMVYLDGVDMVAISTACAFVGYMVCDLLEDWFK